MVSAASLALLNCVSVHVAILGSSLLLTLSSLGELTLARLVKIGHAPISGNVLGQSTVSVEADGIVVELQSRKKRPQCNLLC